MTEENEKVEENTEESEQWEPSTDSEIKASKLGYHPDKGEKTAEQFLAYHEVRQEFKDESKSNKKLQAEFKRLQEQNDLLSKNQSTHISQNIALYENRIDILETNLVTAKEAGEADMAVNIMEQLGKERIQLNALKGTKTTVSATDLDTTILDNWTEDNDWVNDGSEKAQYAKDLFTELNDEAMRKLPPNAPQATVDAKWRRMLRQVNKEVAEEFGEDEVTPAGSRKKAPARVKGAKTTERASNVHNIKNLQPDEKAIYNAQVKSASNPRGIWTEKQFWEKLAKAKEGTS